MRAGDVGGDAGSDVKGEGVAARGLIRPGAKTCHIGDRACVEGDAYEVVGSREPRGMRRVGVGCLVGCGSTRADRVDG